MALPMQICMSAKSLFLLNFSVTGFFNDFKGLQNAVFYKNAIMQKGLPKNMVDPKKIWAGLADPGA